MSTHLQSDTPSVPAKREFPKIDEFFDTAEHIAWRATYLIFKIGFLMFLIYELALFGKHLLTMWGHA